VLALAAPLSATAAPNSKGSPHGFGFDKNRTFVDASLLAKAKKNPLQMVKVIIQSNFGASNAANSLKGLAKHGRTFDMINGVTATLPAKLVERLQKIPGLTVTVDAPVRSEGGLVPLLQGLVNVQQWPYVTGNANLWASNASVPTIAVVDSGVNAAGAGLGNRLLANVNVSSLPNNSAGDGRGHGTFVASIAASSAFGHAGAAPKAKVVSLDVSDDQGMSYVSDVINAAQWIYDHKSQYNIKVANFSLTSSAVSSFQNDPLDKAVEKLWFSGVTVVAAAGNYGHTDGTVSGVRYAPGNDPFVITVGATDTMSTGKTSDDTVAPWSAYGPTPDGFRKPEISAPGRYMIGAVPALSNIALLKPLSIVTPGWMQLSGTSFAAPVVAGTAAQLLALHPSWTPDQVKGALMASASRLPLDVKHAGGVGELNAQRAAFTRNPVNPNAPLEQFVSTDAASGAVAFDDEAFKAEVASNISWDTISWDTISWDTISWDTISWDTISWDTISWDTISWDTVFAEDALGSAAAADEGTAPGYDSADLGDAVLQPAAG
jgi:serine protease AprX